MWTIRLTSKDLNCSQGLDKVSPEAVTYTTPVRMGRVVSGLKKPSRSFCLFAIIKKRLARGRTVIFFFPPKRRWVAKHNVLFLRTLRSVQLLPKPNPHHIFPAPKTPKAKKREIPSNPCQVTCQVTHVPIDPSPCKSHLGSGPFWVCLPSNSKDSQGLRAWPIRLTERPRTTLSQLNYTTEARGYFVPDFENAFPRRGGEGGIYRAGGAGLGGDMGYARLRCSTRRQPIFFTLKKSLKKGNHPWLLPTVCHAIPDPTFRLLDL